MSRKENPENSERENEKPRKKNGGNLASYNSNSRKSFPEGHSFATVIA